MPGRLNGFSLAYTAVGGVVLWSGIKGTSLTDTFRSLTTGALPAPGTEPITAAAEAPADQGSANAGEGTGGTAPGPGDTGAHTTTAAANQALGKLLAGPYGWSTGQEWSDLVSLWNQESGWSNTARNPSSGAYGIAQALGHGPTNQYPAGPANPPVSSASAQISWGLSYIKSTYGSPSAAWAHEVSHGWY